jgi:hypothetical protein
LNVPESLRPVLAASLLLVRPDHYVAWRGEADEAEPPALLNLVRGAANDTWGRG